MKHTIGSYVLDLLTPGEHKQNLDDVFNRFLVDRYRGVDYLAFAGLGDGKSTLQVPGPRSGYVWALQLVSVQCSAAITSLSVYFGENTTSAPVAYTGPVAGDATNQALYTWSRNAAILKDERSITLSVNAGIINSYRLHVKEVPNEMIGKL